MQTERKTIKIFDTDIEVEKKFRKFTILTDSIYHIFVAKSGFGSPWSVLNILEVPTAFLIKNHKPDELLKLTREVIKLQPQATTKINAFYLRYTINYYIGNYSTKFDLIPADLMISVPFNDIFVPYIYRCKSYDTKIQNLIEIFKLCDKSDIDIIQHFETGYSGSCNKIFKGQIFNEIDNSLNILSGMQKPESKVITYLIKLQSTSIILKMIKYWGLDSAKLFEKAIKGKDYSTMEVLYPTLSKKLRVENWENMIRAIPGLIRSSCEPEIFQSIEEIAPIEWEHFKYEPPAGKTMYCTKTHPVNLSIDASPALIAFLKEKYPDNLNFGYIKKWMEKYLADKDCFDETFFEITELFKNL